ncbi:unnamed protein product [Protopolystoma xenopodis]|uniref:Uncharacterized protein n=1 Tax=Protopolystoma xenopodis TaxID=117903 RepID=A0A448WE76_9PLAT|nr:unnamed protein product [Protopolystoma xenopodis]
MRHTLTETFLSISTCGTLHPNRPAYFSYSGLARSLSPAIRTNVTKVSPCNRVSLATTPTSSFRFVSLSSSCEILLSPFTHTPPGLSYQAA